MAKVKLFSNGMDEANVVFSFNTSQIGNVKLFIDLVRNGGVATGLINPVIWIKSNGEVATVSAKNNWFFESKWPEDLL